MDMQVDDTNALTFPNTSAHVMSIEAEGLAECVRGALPFDPLNPYQIPTYALFPKEPRLFDRPICLDTRCPARVCGTMPPLYVYISLYIHIICIHIIRITCMYYTTGGKRPDI